MKIHGSHFETLKKPTVTFSEFHICIHSVERKMNRKYQYFSCFLIHSNIIKVFLKEDLFSNTFLMATRGVTITPTSTIIFLRSNLKSSKNTLKPDQNLCFKSQYIYVHFLKNKTSRIFPGAFALLSLSEQIQTHLVIQTL